MADRAVGDSRRLHSQLLVVHHGDGTATGHACGIAGVGDNLQREGKLKSKDSEMDEKGGWRRVEAVGCTEQSVMVDSDMVRWPCNGIMTEN